MHAPRRISVARALARAFLLALLAVTAACPAPPPGAPRRAIAPPYRADAAHPARLRVRADLDALIESQRVGASDARAQIVGHGRLGFAPNASYAVRVPYPSFVERVRVGVDDPVVLGAPLVELRSSDVARLRAEVANGQVNATAERQTLERLERLVADGTATERELSEARARLQSTQTQLAGARAALHAAGVTGGAGERYTLRASAPGRILARTVDPGERVAPDDAQAAFLIGDPARLVVRVAFPERDAIWLEEGRACAFTVNAVGGDRFEGTIAQIVRAVDPRTRSAEATCAPSRRDPRLAAEMVARVEVQVTGGALVVVPRSAVLLRRDEPVVFVRIEPGLLERRRVELGLGLGDQVQIARGVAAGEQVVVRGAVLLDGELEQLL